MGEDGYFRHSEQELLRIAVSALWAARKAVRELLQSEWARVHVTIKSQDRRKSKDMLYVDQRAEEACEVYLYKKIGKQNLLVLGEETLWRKTHNLKDEKRYVALLDMIDGSDLLERGLGNWCSAVTFFDPRGPRLMFSLIHNSDDKMYLACSDGAFVLSNKSIKSATKIISPKQIGLVNASVCFYAQKISAFTSIPLAFREGLQKLSSDRRGSSKREPAMRLYTLAGNPMMAKMANGEGIHAVFEHRGQYPHDAVPGLHVALKVGAVALDEKGHKLTEKSLAIQLLNPSEHKMTYVVASSRSLAHKLFGLLWGSNRSRK